MSKGHVRKHNRCTPPPSFTAPVDPEEIKFCCGLMNAAYTGRMPTPNPTIVGIRIQDEGGDEIEEICLTDIPFNRSMLAVRQHFSETRDENREHEFKAMSFRLWCFFNFLRLCMEQNDPRLAPFIEMKDGELSSIDAALLEAAATVKVRANGFTRKELFAKARELAEAFHNTPSPANRPNT